MNTSLEKIESVPVPNLAGFASEFLSDAEEYLPKERITEIVTSAHNNLSEIKKTLESNDGTKSIVTYDRFKKRFSVGVEEGVTIGAIIASRHLGTSVQLPQSLEASGDGKKLVRIMTEKISTDQMTGELNRELGTNLAEKTRMKDVMKSDAYLKIAERSGLESKQMGVKAEQVVMGALEAIAIDRPDLGLSVMSANAYQDVEEKIDFIISTKQKRRGVGFEKGDVSFDEKHIGIQFTVNTSKKEHKLDQIAKAKERGVDVDDILYVAIDMKILSAAIYSWEKDLKPIRGPWSYLPETIRKIATIELFQGILTPEQVKTLQ